MPFWRGTDYSAVSYVSWYVSKQKMDYKHNLHVYMIQICAINNNSGIEVRDFNTINTPQELLLQSKCYRFVVVSALNNE